MMGAEMMQLRVDIKAGQDSIAVIQAAARGDADRRGDARRATHERIKRKEVRESIQIILEILYYIRLY